MTEFPYGRQMLNVFFRADQMVAFDDEYELTMCWAAAKLAGLPFNEWIRQQCIKEAVKKMPKTRVIRANISGGKYDMANMNDKIQDNYDRNTW